MIQALTDSVKHRDVRVHDTTVRVNPGQGLECMEEDNQGNWNLEVC